MWVWETIKDSFDRPSYLVILSGCHGVYVWEGKHLVVRRKKKQEKETASSIVS